MDNSVVGNYGTLRLMKKNGQGFVAAYPIDDDEITFGRGSSCDVRLYYSWVSPVQCKLFFDDRKAMLTVLGANGVVIDGCQVLPTESGQPATVPLSNGSRIVINTKQFVFEYPPKEMRAALIDTPRPSPKKSRRSLRLSMIQTSQVFSPLRNVHSAQQDEQMAALTSPVRPFQRDLRDEQEVIMVDGDINNAIVVEEDRDLIVLEEVNLPPVQETPPTPTPAGRRISFATANSLRTPPPNARRRSNFNLHKAVLLRSAQKVHEKQAEENEEHEVELAVSPERELGPPSDESDSDDEQAPTSTSNPLASLRTGLDVIKGVFGRKSTEGSVEPKAVTQDEEAMDQDESDSDSDQNVVLDYGTADGATADEATTPSTTIPSASPGEMNPFYTPQPLSRRMDMRAGTLTGPRRVPVDSAMNETDGVQERRGFSFGGAQRVRVVEPWKMVQIQADSATQASAAVPQTSKVMNTGDEDAQVVIDRMKGKVEEMRRKSIARRERNSLAGGRGLFDLQPMPSPASFQRLPSPTRNQSAPDVIMEDARSQSRKTETEGAVTSSTEAPSLYPWLPTIDFSGRRPRSPVKTVPATPVLSGVHELFATVAPAETPALSGVKDLFKMPAIRTVHATPALQAASAMFAEEASNTSNGMEHDDDIPQRPAARITQPKPSSNSSNSTATEDLESSLEMDRGSGKPTSGASIRPARKGKRLTPEPGAPASEIAGGKTKRTAVQARVLEPSESGEDELLLEAAPQATKALRAQRTPVSTDDDSQRPASRIARPSKSKASASAREPAAAPEAKKPARTTRSADKVADLNVPAATKTSRRTRTPEVESTQEDAPKKARTATKTTTVRKVSAPVADKENDEASSTGEPDAASLKPASQRRVAAKTAKSAPAAGAPVEAAPRVTRSRTRK